MENQFRIVQLSGNCFALEKLVIWKWKVGFLFWSRWEMDQKWMRVNQFGEVLFPGTQFYVNDKEKALSILNGFSEYPKYILKEDLNDKKQ
jgi:hypothetical protein